MSIKKVISILPLIVIAGIGVFYYTRHKDEFELITTVSSGAIVIMVLLKLVFIACHSIQVKILTDHYNLKLKFSEWFGLSRLTNVSNLVLPSGGGTSIKAVYLKKIHNLRYSSFIAVTAIASIIRYLMMAFFASVLLLFIDGQSRIYLLSVSCTVFIVALIFLLFAHKIRDNFLPFQKYFQKIIDEWRLVRTDHKMIMKIIFLNCIIFLLGSMEMYVAFKVFLVDISVMASGIIMSFTTFLGALRILPSHFGIREVVIVGIANMYGVDINQGVHAAVLSRIVGIVLGLVFAPYFTQKLFHKLGKPTRDK